MADYYTQFSFIIPLTPEQTDEILKDLENPEITENIFEDPEFINIGYAKYNDGLWVYSEECGSTNDATNLLNYAINKYNLPAQGFEWSHSCSKPRLDGFGGGAVWTNGETVDSIYTGNWLQEHKELGC